MTTRVDGGLQEGAVEACWASRLGEGDPTRGWFKACGFPRAFTATLLSVACVGCATEARVQDALQNPDISDLGWRDGEVLPDATGAEDFLDTEVDATTCAEDARHSLVVSAVSSSAVGKVVSVPEGIDCGETCTAYFCPGTAVALAATGSACILGWGGDCTGTGPCLLKMDAPRAAGAVLGTLGLSGPPGMFQMLSGDSYVFGVVDVDGNGTLDIVASGGNVFLNDGKGAFTPASTFDLEGHCAAVIFGDLNGDGKPDVVCPDSMLKEYVWVALNKGGGEFSELTTYKAMPDTHSLVLADIDGDAALDIAASCDSGIYTLHNRGDGSFDPYVSQPEHGTVLPHYFGSIVAADLADDGKTDLIFSATCFKNVTEYFECLVLLAGRGDGTFADGVEYPSTGGYGLAVGDINGDGRIDVVESTLGGDFTIGDALTVFLNAGDGTLLPGVPIAKGLTGAGRPALADFDGDGKTDIAVEAVGDATIVLLNQGDGTFGRRADYGGCAGESVYAGDFNGDGKPDLLDCGGRELRTNLGDGTFATKDDYPVELKPSQVVVRDLNADGLPDIVVMSLGTSESDYLGGGSGHATVSVFLNVGNGKFGARADYQFSDVLGTGPDVPFSLAVADANQDGSPDIVVAADDNLAVLPNDGHGSFGAAFHVTPATLSGTLLGMPRKTDAAAFGDLDGDGNPEMVVHEFVHVAGASDCMDGELLDVYSMAPGLTPLALHRYTFNFSGYPNCYSRVACGMTLIDLNGDGRPDVVVAYPTATGVLLNDGTGNLLPPAYYKGGNGCPAGLADVNGDGRPDLVRTTIVLEPLRVAAALRLNHGDGTFGDVLSTDLSSGSVSVGSTGAVGGDINGDGRPDVATVVGLTNVGDGNRVIVAIGNGDGTFSSILDYPVGGDPVSIELADLDGDGRQDLVVANKGSNSISVLLNRCLPLSLAKTPSAPGAMGSGWAGALLTPTTSQNSHSIAIPAAPSAVFPRFEACLTTEGGFVGVANCANPRVDQYWTPVGSGLPSPVTTAPADINLQAHVPNPPSVPPICSNPKFDPMKAAQRQCRRARDRNMRDIM